MFLRHAQEACFDKLSMTRRNALRQAQGDGGLGCRVALAGGGRERVAFGEIGVAQAHRRGADVFFQVGDAARAGDRDDVLALREDPRRRDLTVRGAIRGNTSRRASPRTWCHAHMMR